MREVPYSPHCPLSSVLCPLCPLSSVSSVVCVFYPLTPARSLLKDCLSLACLILSMTNSGNTAFRAILEYNLMRTEIRRRKAPATAPRQHKVPTALETLPLSASLTPTSFVSE